MRRKKHLDRGGGGTELFICFTSRPSSASVAGGAAPSTLRASSSSKLLSPGRGGGGSAAGTDAPAPPLNRSLSRRLRNSGSLKGAQSPMFPSGSTGGRRGRAGFEPAEPSSPKVTCIGQVRVKGGKRRPKHASAAALRSRSRRGSVGGSEASFRRAGDDRDGPQGKNQGWVYQIPVNICEALKTFGSCGGRSLCSPSRGGGERGALSAGAHGDKKRRRAPAGGSWLCGAAVARCLLAIQEDDDEEVGKGAAVVPAEEMTGSEVGLVVEGWEVEDEETTVMVGEVEVEKKDEIFVVGKEEEGRVSVCIPPRNALLLMRCRSDPVRMAALATRFWGSPAAATTDQADNKAVGDDDGEEEEDEEEDEPAAVVEEECQDEARGSAVSVKDMKCRECSAGGEDGGAEAGDADQTQEEVKESLNCGDPVEVDNDGHCRAGEEPQIVRKDAALEVSLGEDEERDNQGPDTVDPVVDSKDEEGVPAPENVEEEVKGRRSISSYSPSTALKEERKLRRLSSRRRSSTSSRTSSVSDRVGRRHSFSAETEGRRSSFSGLKDSRRASFSIDRDGRRWSFSIEQEHLVAEPKVLMASRKGKKKNSSEPELEKECIAVVAPNSAEEDQESHEDGKQEATNDGEEGGTAQGQELKQEVEKVETNCEVEGAAAGQVQRRKKSGELPDCLLMMMYEPKLSMEVSKETWVCSTDFVHWKSYQGKNNRGRQKASASGNDAAAMEEPREKENDEATTVVNVAVADESKDEAVVNSAPKPPPVLQKATPPKPATTEQKVKIELPLVANAYAPFVLKRCKSEPLRSSARLAPDACFWKDRHRPLNATGVGF